MSTSSDQDRCARSCWFAAALTGVLVSLLLMFLSGWSFISAFILGFIAAMIVGFGARAMLCSGSQEPMVPAKPAQSSEPAPEPAKPAEADTPPAAPAATAKPASQDPVVKPSTALPGQAELAARKGSWKYGADATAPAPVAAGAAPAALDGPRGGKADDLTRIKGVGPKLSQLLRSMGYHHFDQIAEWSETDVAWMDENLQGFRGRVTRDDWVAQAKILATGGETEFSKRQS